mmetsp:Transcript_8500/g.21944  ORF Transcript_8500/g.21944 Transcript_8500/m.21944 type:complete len:126 (-) Transcript_8500:271-648(-)
MDDLEDDDPVADQVPSVPIGTKRLRACLVSKLVKTEAQFIEEGCENVPELPIRGDRDAMLQCTTPHFDGMVALMDPEKSWVGRWQGISKLHPGCYALKVYGNLSVDMVEILEENGRTYTPNEEDD